jgi:hypothetical protein
MRIALVLVVLIGSVGCGKDATKDLEVFADRACVCADKKDATCAQGVLDDLVTFANQNKRAHGDESKTKASGERMGMCLIRAGIAPDALMSKLKHLQD